MEVIKNQVSLDILARDMNENISKVQKTEVIEIIRKEESVTAQHSTMWFFVKK